MTTNIEQPDYLIRAATSSEAELIALDYVLADDTWLRISPTTTDDNTVYKKDATPPKKKAKAPRSGAEYDEGSLRGERDVRVLIAPGFGEASQYAAARNWWLGAWKVIVDYDVDDVTEYKLI